MAQKDCEHEGQTGKHCSECGATLIDEVEDRFVKRVTKAVTDVLVEGGILNKTSGKKEDDQRETLADKLYGRKKKEKK